MKPGKREAMAPIIVVSGLPRSGTSMMMKILEEGGLEIVTDKARTADADNPNGYYELEAVKQLPDGQMAWLQNASGKVVKVISALLEYLPSRHNYKVIFMERSFREILVSQQKMLASRNESSTASDAELETEFQRHVDAVKYWLARQPNLEVLYVDYAGILADSETNCQSISRFLGGGLNIEKMRSVPDENLYRNRSKP